MARIAIIGPGAIGGIVAAWLDKAGRHEVFLCGRRPVGTLHIESPFGALEYTPRVVTDPGQPGSVDFVLIATKAYAAKETAAWLPALVTPATTVAVLQNGVEHRERFAPYVPVEQIVPVIVQISAERLQPDQIRHRGSVARLTVPADTRGCAFVELFAGTAIEALAATDFLDKAWRKLCGNAPGILNALVLQPTRLMQDEHIAELTRAITRECVAVGRAEGAAFDPDVVEAVLRGCRNAHPESINSMHADRLAGRPMEVDDRNGVIVRLGRKHGIPTPYNQMAVTLLEALTRFTM
ncbi:MAG: 2-dehydropantoate 2-reductase [Verrucomicrobiota bacterium]